MLSELLTISTINSCGIFNKNNSKGKVAKWSKGMVKTARSPKGNDRAQILAVAAGEADIAVANTYYLASMLQVKKALNKR